MAMEIQVMDHEEIMRAISQLDRALASCLHTSPSTSPSPSPPRQPLQLLHQAAAPTSTSQLVPPARMPVSTPPNAAARSPSCRRRYGVRVSSEAQRQTSVVAARLRRERVSQRMRALQRLVPGGARLDTASMLEEAIRYVRFLKSHVQALEQLAAATGGFFSSPPPYHA